MADRNGQKRKPVGSNQRQRQNGDLSKNDRENLASVGENANKRTHSHRGVSMYSVQILGLELVYIRS